MTIPSRNTLYFAKFSEGQFFLSRFSEDEKDQPEAAEERSKRNLDEAEEEDRSEKT